jgi:hypothetical protein
VERQPSIDRLTIASRKRNGVLVEWRFLALFGAFWEGSITDPERDK